MRKTRTTIAEIPAVALERREGTTARLARVVSLTADGSPQIFLDTTHEAITARLALHATPERLAAAIVQRQQAVVVFEDGDPAKPLIVGFIEPSASHEDQTCKSPFVEADVDGRRVRVTAQDEIVLQCGSASITLRRNGRVVLRGTYIETHSDGTNRIKGGQVQIN